MEVSYFSCRFPDTPYEPMEEPTNGSVCLRIALIAGGALLLIAGMMALYDMPWLYHMGTPLALSVVAASIPMALLGTFLQRIRLSIPLDITQEPAASGFLAAVVPDFLLPLVKKDPPVLILPPEIPLSFAEIRKINGPAVQMYTHGESVGLCLRLRVSHISPLPPDEQSITEPFTCMVLIKLVVAPYSKRFSWYLRAEDTPFKHRKGDYSTEAIFEFHRYSYPCGRALESEKIQEIENQDNLDSEHRFSLEWLLTRLFNQQPVQLREVSTDPNATLKFDSPPIGYWSITIDSDKES